jgi:hypothetical protein
MNLLKTKCFMPPTILCVGWFCDTMGERIGRIGRIRTDFFLSFRRKRPKRQKIPTE